jgi:hypothetical protein
VSQRFLQVSDGHLDDNSGRNASDHDNGNGNRNSAGDDNGGRDSDGRDDTNDNRDAARDDSGGSDILDSSSGLAFAVLMKKPSTTPLLSSEQTNGENPFPLDFFH